MLSQNQICGVIYLIHRQHCGKSYIGETKRKFASRLKEDQKAVEYKQSATPSKRRSFSRNFGILNI